MLIPICCERLPVHMQISVMSARGLPIMDKSISSTDAFVEIHFDDEIWKSEVVTDLNPFWKDAQWTIDTDEKQLAEEAVDIRVMDHDTYSANDAIGRVHLDVNLLISQMRTEREDQKEFRLIMPIYDTLLGIRGELTFLVNLHLLAATTMSSYVQFSSGHQIAEGLQIVEVLGLVHELSIEKDPEYEWLDRIRTPRATNEARQAAIRKSLRDAALSVADKAHNAGGNMVLCYRESIDVEGSSSDFLCVRVYGTAVRVEHRRMGNRLTERIAVPIISLPSIAYQVGCGGMVVARSVQVLDDDDNAESKRKSWWASLRAEIFQQTNTLNCNLVIGYAEQCTVHDGVAVLSCSGTAVLFGTDNERDRELSGDPQGPSNHLVSSRCVSSDRLHCSPFHVPFTADDVPFQVKMGQCAVCKKFPVSETFLSTGQCPSSPNIGVQKYSIQVSVTKRIAKTDDREEFATEISNMLPVSDHDMYNALLAEARSIFPQGNSFFESRSCVTFCDDLLVVVVTALLVKLVAIQKDDVVSPSLSSVLSFPGLQRYGDARRFSWGSVRDAIRLRPSLAPCLQMKVMHLRAPGGESVDEGTPSKHRKRLSSFVGKLKKKQHEKEFMSHVVFERQLCAQIGVIDSVATPNINSIAGLHPAPPTHSQILNKEQSATMGAFGRWSAVFIREDGRSLKDSAAVDGFVGGSLDDGAAIGKALMQGCGGAAMCSFDLSSFHMKVGKDQASAIVLLSADLATNVS